MADTSLSSLYQPGMGLMDYFLARGGNPGLAGGLLMKAGSYPTGTSIQQIVDDYMAPMSEEQKAADRDILGQWDNMYLNSELWNPNGANSYAIQQEANGRKIENAASVVNPNYVGTTVDQSKQPGWYNNYSSGGSPLNSQSTGSEIRKPTVTSSTPTNTNGATSTGTTGLQRGDSKSAYSGAAQYNQFQSPLSNNSGLGGMYQANEIQTPKLNTDASIGKRGYDFSRALWR